MTKIKNLLWILMCFSLISCQSTKVKPNTVENQVLLTFNGLVEASKALDTKAYFSYFDQSKFIGLNSDGSNWNSFNDLAKLITPAFDAIKKVISLQFTNVKISVIDAETAILVNEYRQTVELKDGSIMTFAGGGTQVWSKHSGQWKLVSVSASNQL